MYGGICVRYSNGEWQYCCIKTKNILPWRIDVSKYLRYIDNILRMFCLPRFSFCLHGLLRESAGRRSLYWII